MTKISIILIWFLIPFVVDAQNEYFEIAERKIAKDAIEIADLKKVNKNLLKEISKLRKEKFRSAEERKSLEEKLQYKTNLLYENNLFLQSKENEIILLKKNVNSLVYQNSELESKLNRLSTKISNLIRENEETEEKLANELRKEGRIAIVQKAKEEAIKTVLFGRSVIYFSLGEEVGEQIEKQTGFIFFVDRIIGNYIVLRIQFKQSEQNESMTLNGQGGFKTFRYKNDKYKITLLKGSDEIAEMKMEKL